uniref:MAGUK p55 subfamily member 7 n=1 Tax=Denticeps clupeoides TaxID=299321 RepID=A0AAY4BJ32_9TELE
MDMLLGHTDLTQVQLYLNAFDLSLTSLLQIHEKLKHYEDRSPTPVENSAETLVSDVTQDLQSKMVSVEIRELLNLLSKPHSLLSVHDTVAQGSYDPEIPPLPDNMGDEEDYMKIIRLVKNKEPLVAALCQFLIVCVCVCVGGGGGGVCVCVHVLGLIHVGDELKEVNGTPVDDKKPEEVILILVESQGTLTFKIAPAVKDEPSTKEPKVEYCDDRAIPCKEAGVSFCRGDILQVVCQDDGTWWQARHHTDANPHAGLISSKQFQER